LRTVKLSDIIFDELIYPRQAHDPALVQRYTDCIDAIEAQGKYISISQDNKLLDGKHRWLAYRKTGDDEREIKAFVWPVTAPHDQLKLAARLNNSHGWQLTEQDKESTAKALYSYGCTYEDIAATLSVGKAKVSQWLARTVKEDKDRRNKKIFDMWLACYTQEDIAKAVACDQSVISDLMKGFMVSVLENQNHKAAASHAIDFDLPIYNV
jgi:predicted transcriptional regulator